MLHSSLHKVTNSDAFTLNKNLLSLVMTMHIVQIVISLYLQKDKQADEATTSTSSTGTNSTTSTNIEMGDFPATSAGAPALTGSFDADRINEFAGTLGRFLLLFADIDNESKILLYPSDSLEHYCMDACH